MTGKNASVDALGVETGLLQRFEYAVDVVRAVCFDGDPKGDRICVMAGRLELVVVEGDHVGTLVGQHLSDLEQLSRHCLLYTSPSPRDS